jgi:hypothetical protein
LQWFLSLSRLTQIGSELGQRCVASLLLPSPPLLACFGVRLAAAPPNLAPLVLP